ncbi:unnamed protein product [Closterium sp. Yama58-4]|nr:unnamed protein product [Closterium sp. Yama58-4]
MFIVADRRGALTKEQTLETIFDFNPGSSVGGAAAPRESAQPRRHTTAHGNTAPPTSVPHSDSRTASLPQLSTTSLNSLPASSTDVVHTVKIPVRALTNSVAASTDFVFPSTDSVRTSFDSFLSHASDSESAHDDSSQHETPESQQQRPSSSPDSADSGSFRFAISPALSNLNHPLSPSLSSPAAEIIPSPAPFGPAVSARYGPYLPPPVELGPAVTTTLGFSRSRSSPAKCETLSEEIREAITTADENGDSFVEPRHVTEPQVPVPQISVVPDIESPCTGTSSIPLSSLPRASFEAPAPSSSCDCCSVLGSGEGEPGMRDGGDAGRGRAGRRCCAAARRRLDWGEAAVDRSASGGGAGGKADGVTGEENGEARTAERLAEGSEKGQAAAPVSTVPVRSKKRRSAHVAAREGDVEALRDALAVRPGAINERQLPVCQTPLHLAVAEGQLEALRFLLDWREQRGAAEVKADVEARNMFGETPIHVAAKSSNADAIRLLIRAGARADVAATNGMTPLHLAVWAAVQATSSNTSNDTGSTANSSITAHPPSKPAATANSAPEVIPGSAAEPPESAHGSQKQQKRPAQQQQQQQQQQQHLTHQAGPAISPSKPSPLLHSPGELSPKPLSPGELSPRPLSPCSPRPLSPQPLSPRLLSPQPLSPRLLSPGAYGSAFPTCPPPTPASPALLLEANADPCAVDKVSTLDKDGNTPMALLPSRATRCAVCREVQALLQRHISRRTRLQAELAVHGAKLVMDQLEKELSSLVGLHSLKQQLRTWGKGLLLDQRRRALGLPVPPRRAPHMAFLGSPGTGKTTVARVLARMLALVGVLPLNKVVEVQRTDLVGEYVGHTGPKTRRKIEEAEGGILFVDEAYRLMPCQRSEEKDYGIEALEEIMTVMDSGKLVVIFAGYAEPMQRVFEANEGFKRRVTKCFTFDDLSPKEIARVMLLKMGYGQKGEQGKWDGQREEQVSRGGESVEPGRWGNVERTCFKSSQQVEEKQMEEKQIEEKQIEEKQIEEKQIEEKQIEEKQIEEKQIEEKQIEEKGGLLGGQMEQAHQVVRERGEEQRKEEVTPQGKQQEEEGVDEKEGRGQSEECSSLGISRSTACDCKEHGHCGNGGSCAALDSGIRRGGDGGSGSKEGSEGGDDMDISPLTGFRLHSSCSEEALAEAIIAHTTAKQRRERNGGMAVPVLLDARDHLDLRLPLDCCCEEELMTIHMHDIEAALGMLPP